MIKGPQIKQLQAEKDHEFHYITAITKPQIETLLEKGVVQMELFDEQVAEVITDEGLRYVLRRNDDEETDKAKSGDVNADDVKADDVNTDGRTLLLSKHQEVWEEFAKLDGCYCLKTDLLNETASKEVIHDRYKDLSKVEWAFRTNKTSVGHPVIRSEIRTSRVSCNWCLIRSFCKPSWASEAFHLSLQ